MKTTAACWKGYTKVGTKMKNGRRVPNCVPNRDHRISEEKSMVIRPRVMRDMLRLEQAAAREFAALTPNERAAYLRAHPRSRFAIAADLSDVAEREGLDATPVDDDAVQVTKVRDQRPLTRTLDNERSVRRFARHEPPVETAADWFSRMSSEKQEEYKREHPHSKYAGGARDSATMQAHHAKAHHYHKRMADAATSARDKRVHTNAMDFHGVAHAMHAPGRSPSSAMSKSDEADRVSWDIRHPKGSTAKPPEEKAPPRPEADEGRVPSGQNHVKKAFRHLQQHYGAKFQNEHNRGYHEIHATVAPEHSDRLHRTLTREGWSHTDQGGGNYMYRHMQRGGYLRRREGKTGDNVWAIHGNVKTDKRSGPGRR